MAGDGTTEVRNGRSDSKIWQGGRVNILFDFENEETLIDSSDKEAFAEAEKLGMKSWVPLVWTEVLFNEKMRVKIKKHRRHFPRFCHNNQRLKGTFFMERNV